MAMEEIGVYIAFRTSATYNEAHQNLIRRFAGI
jgi:hypothetical protein